MPEVIADDLSDLLPVPEPPPELEPDPPTPPVDAMVAALAALAIIVETITRDNDCEDCEKCDAALAGAAGIPSRMPNGNTRPNRVGYEYQHHVIQWFYYDPVGRIIVEFGLGSVWFDGLDWTEGTMLATRAIMRSEYDPTRTSYCYLIDAKYRKDDWFRYDTDKEEFVPVVPGFLIDDLEPELIRQYGAANPFYPNSALVWVFNNRSFQSFADTSLFRAYAPVVRSVYYSYVASEDR